MTAGIPAARYDGFCSHQSPPEDSLCLALIEPGRAYFWKVIAEDGKGGVVEAKLGTSRLNRDVRLEYRRFTRYLEAFSVL